MGGGGGIMQLRVFDGTCDQIAGYFLPNIEKTNFSLSVSTCSR